MKRIIKNTIAAVSIAGALTLVWSGVASAHVTVKPAQAETAAFQSFTVSVPTEGESPTRRVRLVVPGDVKHVTPTVKPGWQIETVKEGEGEDAIVKEIIWSNGTVPVGQRDDFGFSAQMPAEASTLQWKAYQTYADGRTVSWDQALTGDHSEEGGDTGPYSETEVVEELAAAGAADDGHGSSDAAKSSSSDMRSNLAIGLSIVAIIVGVIALTQGRPTVESKKN